MSCHFKSLFTLKLIESRYFPEMVWQLIPNLLLLLFMIMTGFASAVFFCRLTLAINNYKKKGQEMNQINNSFNTIPSIVKI
jgi:hypothetical protein